MRRTLVLALLLVMGGLLVMRQLNTRDAGIPDVVGMLEDEARKASAEQGLVVRITARDGNHCIVTRDYRTDRVNVTVESGVVVAVHVG